MFQIFSLILFFLIYSIFLSVLNISFAVVVVAVVVAVVVVVFVCETFFFLIFSSSHFWCCYFSLLFLLSAVTFVIENVFVCLFFSSAIKNDLLFLFLNY